MNRLSLLDVLIIVVIVALLLWAARQDFRRDRGNVVAAPTATPAAEAKP